MHEYRWGPGFYPWPGDGHQWSGSGFISLDTERGRSLIERARSLEGRWVLVYRYNEQKSTGQRRQSVRMLAHLMDLGVDGVVPAATAKKMVLQAADGDVARAQEAWTAAGMPASG